MGRLLLLFLLVILGTANSFGGIIEFKTDDTAGATLSLDTYTRQLSGLVVDGVTFDAELMVKGSTPNGAAGTLDLNSNGLGIIGAGSVLVSDGELLSFSISMTNFVGGKVSFDGFTEIDFNNFGSSDSGVLSRDASESTAVDNFFTTSAGANIVDISATMPTSFSAIASEGALNSFRVDDVSGQFSGTVAAVPEPSSIAVFVIGFLGVGSWPSRRKRNGPTRAEVFAR